jgi:uncharacterized protein YciW
MLTKADWFSKIVVSALQKPVSNWRYFMKALYILLAVAGTYLPTIATAQISLDTLRTCLDIEDQTKERLDCYDDKIKPAPKQVSAPAKTAQDCRFLKEEDQRLNCFNRFVNLASKPRKSAAKQKLKKPAAGTQAPDDSAKQ